MLLLRSVQWGSLGIALAIMAALALVFAVIIVIVAKYLAVKEGDERVPEVRKLLAGANCGGCGKAGCDDFAKALCEGKVDINNCNPTSSENKAKIAEILGIEFAGGVGEQVAVVACIGGDEAKDKFGYQGFDCCVYENMLAGGKKVCSAGCIGDGTCMGVCPENAINVVNGVAVVDKLKCVACGACVAKCPKKIIKLIPADAKVYIACSSECKGKEVMDACKKGCIGCGLCAKNCPNSAITMVNNLPVIDYSKCTGCKVCVAKCPRKCILER